MSDPNFSQQVLDKIEHEQVRPVPRWVVLLQRSMGWGITIISILCAALFCSLLVIAVQHIDYDVMRAAHSGSILYFLAQYVPVLWIVLFIIFSLFVVFLLRRETHAYRYRGILVVSLVGLGVIFIGACLQLLHVSENAEQYVERGFPAGARPWMMRGHVLPRPEDGILIGRIVDLAEDHLNVERPLGGDFQPGTLRRPTEMWEIRFTTNTVQIVRFRPNDEVVARGAIIRTGVFQAEWIRPHQQPSRPSQMRP